MSVQKSRNLARAKGELESRTSMDVSHVEHGREDFHSETGPFWMPRNLTVRGNLEDPDNIKAISKVCDEYDLKVFDHPGSKFEKSEKGVAQLVEESKYDTSEEGVARKIEE